MKCANKLVVDFFCCSFYALICAFVSQSHCGVFISHLCVAAYLQVLRKMRRLFQNLGHQDQSIKYWQNLFPKQTSLFGWLLSCRDHNDLDTNHICILKCKRAKDLQHWRLSEVSRPTELSGCNFGHWRVEYTVRAVAEILKDSSSWC